MSKQKIGPRVRRANSDDFSGIIDLLLEASGEGYIKETISPTRVLNLLRVSEEQLQLVCFVAETDRIVGLLAASAGEMLYSEEKYALHLDMFVSKDHRTSFAAPRLMSAFMRWTDEIGAKHINALCKDKKTGRLYERYGLQEEARRYAKHG